MVLKTGLIPPSADHSSDLINWTWRWLNQNQIGWTEGQTSKSNKLVSSLQIVLFNQFYFFYNIKTTSTPIPLPAAPAPAATHACAYRRRNPHLPQAKHQQYLRRPPFCCPTPPPSWHPPSIFSSNGASSSFLSKFFFFIYLVSLLFILF